MTAFDIAGVAPQIVHVDLGTRAYDVMIGPGLLSRAGDLVRERLGNRKVAIITDRNVASHHLATLAAPFRADGRLRGEIILEPGEATKCFAQLAHVCERLLELGVERGDLVVALGGGVIGDLAGFAAAILRRGVRFVQIPTSLLAQVDSSVGGKTGINSPQGKNLVGAFHQPSLVLADTSLLASLPTRELRAGYGEVAKYGLLGDAAFFAWLEANVGDVMRLQPAAIAKAVARSVEMKARIVERDETETGERMLLNLGHTFGHALESFTGYSSRLLHGEGVAIGMCLAFRLSEELGHVVPQTAARVAAHLKAVGLPTRVTDIPGDKPDAATMVRLMGQDKKVADGRLTFILARAIGDSFVTRDVSAAEVEAFLARTLPE
ncbi:MAG: 3-dehydroquinate synthase [Hyphomicrobiaceae bacterium]